MESYKVKLLGRRFIIWALSLLTVLSCGLVTQARSGGDSDPFPWGIRCQFLPKEFEGLWVASQYDEEGNAFGDPIYLEINIKTNSDGNMFVKVSQFKATLSGHYAVIVASGQGFLLENNSKISAAMVPTLDRNRRNQRVYWLYFESFCGRRSGRVTYRLKTEEQGESAAESQGYMLERFKAPHPLFLDPFR